MIFGLFRRKANDDVIDAIHGEIMAQARQSAFFANHGVPDTVEGRFEMVALHGALAIRRLEQLAAPGPELAQELTDSIFRHFEVALREMGVGDMTVPKRMKKLASGFLGRTARYRAALEAGDLAPLIQALGHNVFGEGEGPGVGQKPDAAGAVALAHYVAALEKVYAGAGLEGFMAGRVPGVAAADFVAAQGSLAGKGA